MACCMPMPDFTWVPDQGAKRSVKAATHKAKFGDGYAQTTGDGINPVQEMWELSFTQKSVAEVMSIASFLSTRKGVVNFTWLTPRGETLKFTCDSWSEVYNGPNDNAITMKFEQWFGL